MELYQHTPHCSERLFSTQHGSSLCWCNSAEQEDYRHLFYQSSKNAEAGQAVLTCIKSYDENLSEENAPRLELTSVDPFLLPCAIILATGLGLI